MSPNQRRCHRFLQKTCKSAARSTKMWRRKTLQPMSKPWPGWSLWGMVGLRRLAQWCWLWRRDSGLAGGLGVRRLLKPAGPAGGNIGDQSAPLEPCHCRVWNRRLILPVSPPHSTNTQTTAVLLLQHTGNLTHQWPNEPTWVNKISKATQPSSYVSMTRCF